MSEFEFKPVTSDSEIGIREEMRLRELLAGLDTFIVGIDEDDDEDWDEDDDWDDDGDDDDEDWDEDEDEDWDEDDE